MRTKLIPPLGSTLSRSSMPLPGSCIIASLVAACCVTAAFSIPAIQAQAPTPHPPAANSAPVRRAANRRQHIAAQMPVPTPTAPVPATPPPPEKPNWPAFADAAPPSVVWNSHGLSVDATNSSLAQILKEVSSATGIKVDGFESDQRIFGSYGPGNAGDVLSQLLQGSGYNVLMIGDLAPGTPRQIILSPRLAGINQPQPRANQTVNEEDNEPEVQPVQEPEPQPQPQIQQRPNFPPGLPPRSPQQVMEEMQQRQQQIQQQQQQQQNNPQF